MSDDPTLGPIAGVCSLYRVGPAGAGPLVAPRAPADVLLELPHGAVTLAEYHALARQMRSTLPPDLEAFFCVNTDVGTPELAAALAPMLAEPERDAELIARVVALGGPSLPRPRSVLVVRSHLPRTLVDCNRVAEPGRGSGLTGLMPSYVRDPDDVTLLRALHGRYLGVARAAWAEVVAHGGRAISLHSYAPRSVAIEQVTDRIVDELRAQWAAPELLPLRPEVDLICERPEGGLAADPALVDAVVAAYHADGVRVARSETYKLHAAAFAGAMALAAPQVALTVEVRRDLLAAPWDPFVEMRVPAARARAMALPLAAALLAVDVTTRA